MSHSWGGREKNLQPKSAKLELTPWRMILCLSCGGGLKVVGREERRVSAIELSLTETEKT